MTEQPWVSASFYLPRGNHCPVEVELVGGKREKRDTTEGDWKLVVRWRSVEGKKKGKD
jgi:hypothetical protein